MAAQGHASLFYAKEVLRLLESQEAREAAMATELRSAVTNLVPLLGNAQATSGDGIKGWLTNVEQQLWHIQESVEDVMTRMRTSPMKTKLCFPAPSTPTLDDLFRWLSIPEVTKNMHESAWVGEEQLALSPAWEGEGKIRVPAGVREELFRGASMVTTTTRDQDRKSVKDFLLLAADDDDNNAASVLVLVGHGGVGKTALARDVFDDQEVEARFKPRIWMTSDSLVYLTDDEVPQVSGFRFLFVVDHVSFPIPQLSDFVRILQTMGAPGSRILVTARHHGSITKTGWKTHYLHHLGVSEGESRDLFAKMAFQGQEPKNEFQVRIGEKIATSCQGLSTTAVMALGGMLYFKDSEAEWRSFYDNDLIPTVSRQSHDPTVDPYTKLCYDNLPGNLKHCFAYCSLFPPDHEFDIPTLIKLWIAQGFIDQGTSDDDLEAVGYEYFLNLLGRSFFHEARLGQSGRVTKCKMHRLMHELSTFVAEERCQLLTQMLEFRSLSGIHHLSLAPKEFPLKRFMSDLFDGREKKNLRSILFPTQVCNDLRESRRDHDWFWMSLIYDSVSLRVLDARGSSANTLPDCIDGLKRLRYLDLSHNENLTELPDSITKLRSLETLRLSSCFRLKQLPRDIGNLVNLRHLENEDCRSLTSLPSGFGRLTNLRTLSQLILSDDVSVAALELVELKELRNLREVRIKNVKHVMGWQISMCLKEMHRVRSLSIEWQRRPPQFHEDNRTELGPYMSSEIEELNLNGFRATCGWFFLPLSPTNLVRLVLRKLHKCLILTPLDECLKLKVLVVDEMHDLEYISEDLETQSFPSLEELWLTELPKLKCWWRIMSPSEPQKQLPIFLRLSKLVIEDCPGLGSMPLFPTLQQGLVLDSTSWNPFELTMDYKATPKPDEASNSSPSPSPLSELSNLCIVGISEVDNAKAEEINWETLKSLKMLKLDHLSGLTALPHNLQKVTSLRELHVWRCGLEHIPGWISKLELLERLVIRMCPKAKSVPENIRSLKHLRALEIEECPTLLWRCRKDTGADWEKVAHIPELRLGRIST